MKKFFSSYWFRSAFYTILQRFSLTFFGFISISLIFREFPHDKEKMGLWALFVTVIGIFEQIKTNLLKNAQVKFVTGTTDPSERAGIASSSLIINISLTVIFILLLVFIGNAFSLWIVKTNELATMLRWFIPGVVCMVFFSHLESVQQSYLDFKGVFAGYFIRQLLFLLILIYNKLAHHPYTLVDLVMYQSISLAAGSLTLYFFTRKYLRHVFAPSAKWIRKIFSYGGYIFGSGTVASIFQNLDQLMIASLGPVQVPFYNLAFRVNGLVDIPSYAAADVLFPKASIASLEEGPGKIKYLYERMVAILLAFTIPLVIFIILFPNVLIHIIAGPGYTDAAPILQLYMIAAILRPAQNQAANLLNSIGKTKLCFYMNCGYLILNFTLNRILLDSIGFFGPAIGTVATFIIAVTGWYFIMKKEVGIELPRIGEYFLGVYKLCYEKIAAIFTSRAIRSQS